MDRAKPKTLGRAQISGQPGGCRGHRGPSFGRSRQPGQLALALGAIGCGARGNWIADLFQKHGKYRYVACADYFQDRADAFGKKYEVPPAARFTSLFAYKRLLEQKLDAVVIETPPYFHPEHAAAAVDAGKHVFTAKPIAIDVPGCLTIGQSGKKAREKKLVFLVDFQTRANEAFRETARRVHAGQIGRIVCAEGRYPTGGIDVAIKNKSPEDRLRTWYPIKELSGDFIVEQSIHALDVATWFLNAVPLQAMGTGGRQPVPTPTSWTIFPSFIPSPTTCRSTFTCLQAIPGAGRNQLPGPRLRRHGVWQLYERNVDPRQPALRRPKMNNLYTEGTVINIAEFHRAVTAGDYANPTVEPSVCANLTAVLGRTAGYKKGQVVTWDEMLGAASVCSPICRGCKPERRVPHFETAFQRRNLPPARSGPWTVDSC